MKLVFGGFGKNILNPAVFGRVFYQLAFTGSLKTSVEGSITTGSSITSVSSGFGTIMGFGEGAPSLFDLAIGNYLGSLGETFAIVLVLIAIYLSIRGIIDWRPPVFYVGSLYLAFVLMFLCAGDGLFGRKSQFGWLADRQSGVDCHDCVDWRNDGCNGRDFGTERLREV